MEVCTGQDVYMYVCLYMLACVRLRACIYTCMHASIRTYIHVCLYVGTYVRMYVCILRHRGNLCGMIPENISKCLNDKFKCLSMVQGLK